jgi:hypothetical protein
MPRALCVSTFRRELQTSTSEVDAFATMTIIELMKRGSPPSAANQEIISRLLRLHQGGEAALRECPEKRSRQRSNRLPGGGVTPQVMNDQARCRMLRYERSGWSPIPTDFAPDFILWRSLTTRVWR